MTAQHIWLNRAAASLRKHENKLAHPGGGMPRAATASAAHLSKKGTYPSIMKDGIISGDSESQLRYEI